MPSDVNERLDPLSRAGSLDPADWDGFQHSVERVLAAAMTQMQTSAQGRVWTPVPQAIRQQLGTGLPRSGTDHTALAERLIELLPFGVGNTHPRFFGWVHGAGSPGNLLAEIIASAMNANCGGRDHVGILIERQVIDWCKELMGFPTDASGLIVSGTSMASIIAAKTARDARLSFLSRTQGLEGRKLTGYTSEQAHSCLSRAFDMLGLGSDALRKVATNKDFQIDTDALLEQITEDRQNGHVPFFVAGTAGTVNTGAIDDLSGLADIAAQEQLWFHVDGAFGACIKTSDRLAERLNGIERAASLAFDFHKWMHVNYDAGCVLIRDADLHRRAFAARPDYLAADGTALAGGEPWPVDFGPELSRGFRALKVWSHLIEHGTDKIAQAIEDNCQQARYLAERLEAHPHFELSAPTALNICCFRYVAPGRSDLDDDAVNALIVQRIQESGIAAPSTTRLHGDLCIRVNITNHRTRIQDMDLLLNSLAEIGDAAVNEWDQSGPDIPSSFPAGEA